MNVEIIRFQFGSDIMDFCFIRKCLLPAGLRLGRVTTRASVRSRIYQYTAVTCDIVVKTDHVAKDLTTTGDTA